MRALFVAAALASTACSAERVVIAAEGATIIVMRIPSGRDPEVVRHRGPLAAPIVFEEEVDAQIHVLEYDDPIDDFIVVDANGSLELAPAAAPIEEAWTLPAPTNLSSWRGPDAPSFDPLALRVRRPPCPTVESEAIALPVPSSGLSALLPLGDGALLGTWPNSDSGQIPQVLYRAPDGAFSPVAGLTFTATSSPPIGFADETTTSLWAPLPDQPTMYGLYDVAIDRTLSAPRRTFCAMNTPCGVLRPTWFTGRRFGARRVIAARFRDGMSAPYNGSILLLHGPDDIWRTAYRGDTGSPTCFVGSRPMVFELADENRLIAGVVDGRIVDIDLTNGATNVADGLALPGAVCRSGLLKLRTGVEILFWEGGTQPNFVARWRRSPTTAWAPLIERPGAPTASALWGDRAMIAFDATILMIEDEPRRPEIAPRVCGPFRSEVVAHEALERDDGILVGSNAIVPRGRQALGLLTLAP